MSREFQEGVVSGFNSTNWRRGPNPFMKRADGAGQRLRSERNRQAELRNRERREAAAQLEQRRKKIAAPVLTTLRQVEKVVESGPKAPIYVVKIDKSLRKIGKAVFGEEGYNVVKTQSSQHDIGPHFDAYARHFSPWTLHENHGTNRFVRAAYLPEDDWEFYLRETNNLERLDDAEQQRRFQLGEELFETGCSVTTASLGHGALTLIWHGDMQRPDLPPPSVHDFKNSILTTGLIRSIRNPEARGVSGRILSLGPQPNEGFGSYTIYAQQRVAGDFEGFTRV